MDRPSSERKPAKPEAWRHRGIVHRASCIVIVAPVIKANPIA
jgi:hypothetical protein